MILFDTPNEEILKIMLSEWEKVSYYMNRDRDKVRKHFLSLPRTVEVKPFIRSYTIPTSRNTYTVVSRPVLEGEIYTWCYLKVDGNSGKRRVAILRKNEIDSEEFLMSPSWILDIYTGHFFSRYRERAGVGGTSIDELIVRFLLLNSKRGIAVPASMVNPAVKDDSQFAIVSSEGLSFVETSRHMINGVPIHINENRTFVAKDNLFYKQAMSLMTTDYFIKRLKLEKAKREGAGAERMMKIMDSGFFEPFQAGEHL